MKIKELINKKRLSITGVISVILTLLNIILIRRVENGIDFVESIWKIIISLSFILTLLLSIIKRNINILFKGIIPIILCIILSYILMIIWIMFFL